MAQQSSNKLNSYIEVVTFQPKSSNKIFMEKRIKKSSTLSN